MLRKSDVNAENQVYDVIILWRDQQDNVAIIDVGKNESVIEQDQRRIRQEQTKFWKDTGVTRSDLSDVGNMLHPGEGMVDSHAEKVGWKDPSNRDVVNIVMGGKM